MAEQEHFYKLLLIGDSGVGKTSLAIRFSDPGEWVDTHLPTIGVDFKIKSIVVDGVNVKLQIWDTAGQERFRSLSETYYRNSHGVIIVYDVTSRESFQSMRKWAEEANKNTSGDITQIIVANKIDLTRVVSAEEGQAIASELNAIYIEVSVKDFVNVNETFTQLAREILKKDKGKPKQTQSNSNAQITATASTSSSCSKKKCLI